MRSFLEHGNGGISVPRMRVLSTAEQESYEQPPQFDSRQRKHYFNLPVMLAGIAKDLRTPASQIGFVLNCGYFRAAKRFFSPNDFHARDVEYVARRLDVTPDAFNGQQYAARTRQRHEGLIVDALGLRRFDAAAEELVKQEIAQLVRAQLKPKLMFWRCIDVLNRQKAQLPTYNRLVDLILEALNQRRRDLAVVIKRELQPETRDLLEALFVRSRDTHEPGTESQHARYRLTLLKSLSQSTRPSKIRERVADHEYLADLYDRLAPLLATLDLAQDRSCKTRPNGRVGKPLAPNS